MAPPSLKNIFKELESEIGMTPPHSGELTGWAKQGVLLLNAVLTVREGAPTSHKDKGWEIFTDTIIEKLNLVTAPHATVIRDGQQVEVETKNVVVDDIIKFSTGNQIIADSIVKKGFVEVNESMITGEPDAIYKKEGDMLFSGSFVVCGSCLAQVEHVGKENYIEKLAMEAKKQKDNKSELLRTLNWIIKVIGFIIIPFAITVSKTKAFTNIVSKLFK